MRGRNGADPQPVLESSTIKAFDITALSLTYRKEWRWEPRVETQMEEKTPVPGAGERQSLFGNGGGTTDG